MSEAGGGAGGPSEIIYSSPSIRKKPWIKTLDDFSDDLQGGKAGVPPPPIGKPWYVVSKLKMNGLVTL